MTCQDCQGKTGWWIDAAGNRAPEGPRAVAWVCCPSCINGVSSCCDGPVGIDGEITNAPEERGDGS